ncbi:hypothetical protein Chor_013429 [Crotalus horridus]
MRAMGKKHKRHKGEKYPYEEYVEKPLKLVLKVGGNEVAELSTQSSVHDSSLYDDKSEHEKHKDKKRKKRKKMEKQEDKKKRDRDAVDSEGERELKCQSPLRLEVPLVKSLASSLAKQEEVEQTPLQEALNQLVRQLQRKDPNAFFSFPVTDFIAPGYSMIIKRPMDFSTMKEKIKNNGYQSIEELKDNFRLMCTNAMVYNKPETIYYKAAKKLLHSGMKILSQERIQSLKQSIDFMADLQKSRKQADKTGTQSGGEEEDGLGKDGDCTDPDLRAFKSPSKEFKKKEKDLLEEKIRNSNLEKEQELIERIIKDSGGKLTKRSANTQCEFERRKPDGTTTLGLLTPAENLAGEMGPSSVKLGATAGRLQSGVNTLQGFKEDKRNKVTPVMYLNYGPFSSYAPAYDSTFANISKDDSDLIYSTYGEDSNPGSFNISEFLAKSHDYPGLMADSLLDVLTQGEHSRTLKELETSTEETECVIQEKTDTTKDIEIIEKDPAKVDSGLSKERLTALKAVTNFGVPTEEFDSEAEKVTNNLKELAQQVAPGDIVSTYGIRKAMGISLPASEKVGSFVDFTEEIQDSPKAVILIENECEPVAV